MPGPRLKKTSFLDAPACAVAAPLGYRHFDRSLCNNRKWAARAGVSTTHPVGEIPFVGVIPFEHQILDLAIAGPSELLLSGVSRREQLFRATSFVHP